MAGPLYDPVDASISFPKMEEEIARSWVEGDIFLRSLEQRRGAPELVF